MRDVFAMNKSNVRQIANKDIRDVQYAASIVRITSVSVNSENLPRFSRSSTVKLSPLRAFKRANNRDFRFYATINRGLLVPFARIYIHGDVHYIRLHTV